MKQVISITTCDTFMKIHFVWETFHIIPCFVQQISQGESFQGYDSDCSEAPSATGKVSGCLNPLPESVAPTLG